MSSARMILVALMGLVPTVALADGSDGHPFDPNLHVDPSLEDCSVIFAPELTQAAFARFAREFGSVSAFKMITSPAPLGRGNIALGVEQITFDVEDKSAAWNDTFAHPDGYHELGSTQVFPKARLRVGVSDKIDVGAFYTRNPNANYGWAGLDVRYGMFRQSETMPIDLALRGAYTKTLYVRDMDMHAATVDVAAGRTFGNLFMPYVGMGGDLVYVRETSDVVDLHEETQIVPHVMGGMEVRVWHVALGAEGQLADVNSFQMQVTALF